MKRTNLERQRLADQRDRKVAWNLWGPYLAERQWGTVREDYSPDAAAWDDFPHDHARSRAYRWGEDGLLGISDERGQLCFAWALWNGRDPILKERLFGLTNREGNHGEDVKELYYYLDATPSHGYLKALYKYPQRPLRTHPMSEPTKSDPHAVAQTLLGQTALVTGASSGIGKAVALALARAGADVVVNYASKVEAAAEIASEIEAMGRRAVALRGNVASEAEVEAMFERAIETFGTLDILVANAGLQRDAPIDRMTLAEWQEVIDVNLTGQFLCMRAAVREFKKRGVNARVSRAAGKIVCMSSVHDVIPWAGHANYAASKGGVMMLMKSLAQELAPHKIRVNSVCPGAIRTPINRSAWETPEALESLHKLIPLKRIGEPEDIGKAVVWLASDEADYVTGLNLYVDGGMTLYPGFESGG